MTKPNTLDRFADPGLLRQREVLAKWLLYMIGAHETGFAPPVDTYDKMHRELNRAGIELEDFEEAP